MNQGEVGFMNLTALLHFSEKGGVLFATGHKEEAASLAVEPADEGKEFLLVVVAEPVDQSESAVGSGGVYEPTGRFVYDQEGGVIEEDGGFHDQNFEERSETSKRGRIKIRIKMSM